MVIQINQLAKFAHNYLLVKGAAQDSGSNELGTKNQNNLRKLLFFKKG